MMGDNDGLMIATHVSWSLMMLKQTPDGNNYDSTWLAMAKDA